MELHKLIGEATAYDKKENVERSKPKSWLKSVSAFANGEGGMLIFGISDDDKVVGLPNAKADSEFISEAIKTKLDPVPEIDLRFEEQDGAKVIVLTVKPGQETPYYYIGDKQRLAYARVGNETVVADRTQLKALVLRGSGRTYDSLPSPYKFENMAFTKLKSVHYKRLGRPFEDADFASWGIVDEQGNLTNAGALIADESPVRHSRIFCTRWNGLTMTNGLGEALDDVELEGSVIGQLQDAVAFVRNNSRKKWWKTPDHREELPDYPERAVTEVITNAIIHRDYLQIGSEVHIDMYDDRMEIYSPGGMIDGKQIQDLDPTSVSSKRRNPLIADFFSRLGLMERRGSGMRKIMDAYRWYKMVPEQRMPQFRSDNNEFHVLLWNINYNVDDQEEDSAEFGIKFVKGQSGFGKEFVKEELEQTKEFLRASRLIYKLISKNAQVTANEIAKHLNLSERQVQKYMKRLQDQHRIERVGGRKTGFWRIIDDEYERFFERL